MYYISLYTTKRLRISKYTGRWCVLSSVSACRTSSSAVEPAAGLSARKHRSSTFRPFDPETSPGGGAVTWTSLCHPCRWWFYPLRLFVELAVISPAPVFPFQPEPEAAFFHHPCQFFHYFALLPSCNPASLRTCMVDRPTKPWHLTSTE